MEYGEFMTKLIKYYGPPDCEEENDLVVEFLIKHRVPQRNLNRFFKIICEEFSKRWRKFPDVAIVKEVYDKHRKEVHAAPAEWYVEIPGEAIAYARQIKPAALPSPDDIKTLSKIGGVYECGDG
jgi:hypothetical protein